MIKLFLIVLILLAPSVARSQAPAPGQAPAGSHENGYKAYMKYQCYTCHGTIGQGGGAAGPRIAPSPFPWVAFEYQVRKPRQDMPPYREAFVSNQELADMYAYLLTIQPAATVKDIPLLDFSENSRAQK
jgi:ubiquinol-cytochrome c reductase cytochrome c subunit